MLYLSVENIIHCNALIPVNYKLSDRFIVVTFSHQTLASGHNNVVKQMVSLIVTDTKKQTVGSSFKKQLEELMTKIRATQSHYVRCIKPNGFHKPEGVESHEMLRQLKCSGVSRNRSCQSSRSDLPA